jgi:hypothetical protein
MMALEAHPNGTVGAVYEGVKNCSLFNVQMSFVIFGGAFGTASLTKHCA